ncbi:MAG: hypothetical protein V2A62_03095 [Candidatus Woesearchaeota archaeon]
MEEKKSPNEILHKKLSLDKKSAWHQLNEKEVMRFAEGYKQFIGNSKTERLCIENIITALKKAGFKENITLTKLKPGDKFFKNIKGKAVLAAIVGRNPASWQLIGAHVDSPRLDIKPQPLYEDSGVALLKTHYYGGVKKYHWVNTPLALHGVVFTKSGRRAVLSIGEKPEEPKFIIPDLLPHLAKNQMERKAEKVVEGEELNILIGNLPVNDEKIKEQVKFMVLKHLQEKYGIIEEDFFAAELELVPVNAPVDIGFDRALVGAYGQDDKVCIYTELMALTETNNPAHTAVGLFVDKEEIGSTGDTGAASLLVQNLP